MNSKNQHTEYAFEKGLTNLHRESIKWLSAIEFWKFELNFFQKLIDKNFFRVTLPDKMEAFNAIEMQLAQFRTERINQLEIEIKKHEHYLNKIESGDSDADDVSYRRQHSIEAEKVQKGMNEIHSLKRELYNLIEHVTD